jgi:hypothetical protein
VASRGVEAAAVALFLLDAGIGGESRGLGAPGTLDALRDREPVDIFVVKVEIAGQLAHGAGLGQTGKGIFRGNLREVDGTGDQMIEACRGEVAGGGVGGAMRSAGAEKDAQAYAAGA